MISLVVKLIGPFFGFSLSKLRTQIMVDATARHAALRLLSLIAAAGEPCSCEFEGPLERSQPTISHHTKALADARLITGEKRAVGCGGPPSSGSTNSAAC